MRLTKLVHACVRLEKDGRALVIEAASHLGGFAAARKAQINTPCSSVILSVIKASAIWYCGNSILVGKMNTLKPMRMQS